ncbi:DUF4886 domain-containing protein [Blastopirellula sp. J2-11]|uniref:DUF4886 domain-containing protein n=1 Tax=Blastopirellula sp. J2-11 TaxID=2943192 RepID=UPI0021C7109E|nr:DUF4886 domain-containing protein [Blastopirellula sp. J2-11]UUO09188.1 DUF4886 domain-containing protein [Blastopirellula sp. J2-11]
MLASLSNGLLWLAALTLFFQLPYSAQGKEPAANVRTVRLLTIGNSFADNACTYLPEMFQADPTVNLVLKKANLGGCSLERHWNNAVAAVSGQEGKKYQLLRNGKKESASLQQMLIAEPWDVVTLQQVSSNSWRLETYHPYGDNLVALIGKNAPQAKIAFHQTWAYRIDAPLLSQWKISQAEMYEQLTQAYGQVAEKFQAPVIPSGAAIQAYRQRADRQYVVDKDFNFQSPPAKGLPRQENSLVVGWSRNQGTGKLKLDPKHMNKRGKYLLGAVWFEALTGHDIRKNGFAPKGIPADELRVLQEIAHDTVASFPQPAVSLHALQP